MTSYLVDWEIGVPAPCRRGAVAVGNFDGVHRGHAALVAELLRRAKRLGGPAVAVTFDPHPVTVLNPRVTVPRLTSSADRAQYLQEAGVDAVVTLRTTPELLALEARDFFDLVICKGLEARAMVEGANFGFGRNRNGDIALLGALCQQKGIELGIVDPVVLEGAPVSSSRIRASLKRGAVEEAGRLLGRAYRMRGTVEEGARRGRTIGFPTANLRGLETIVPGEGVYAVRVRTSRGDEYPGAANVGGNPTFGTEERKFEVHLIGFEGDLYGEGLAVDFVGRLRDTQRFAGVSELVEQLRQDVDQARQVVGKAGREKP